MRFYITLSLLFFAFITINAQKKTILKSTPTELIIEFEFNENNYSKTTYNHKEFIQFNANETYLEKGAPGLPYYSFSVQLPSNNAASFQIIDKEQEISTNNAVFPSKGNIKRNNVKDTNTPYFGAYYSKNENYPLNAIIPSKPFQFRTITGQSFFLFPYQYNPVTQQLKFTRKITVAIRFSLNQQINELNQVPNTKLNEQLLKDHFLNTPTDQKRTPTQLEDGDLLVVVNENYLNDIQPFIDWKNQKGIKTKVVSVPTSTYTDYELKSIIQQEYQSNSNLLYVLLIGEHSEIPSHSYGIIDGDENWSDSYYGQMTDDLYPELFVGRITGSNQEIKTIISKTIDYEKKKTLGNWMTTSIGIGSNEGLNEGDNNEADWQHLRKIKSNLEAVGYTNVYEFYDGSHGQNDKDGNPLKSDVLSAINQGAGLINYTGHGDTQSIQTTGLTNSDIGTLQNNGKLPFVVSVACNNGKFIGYKCLSEAWLSATKNNEPTGAVAACGSSILMDWAPPMKTQDEIVTLLAAPTSTKNSLGSLFYTSQIAMLQKYGNLGTTTMNTWLFFGDPTLEFSYQNPSQLNFTSTLQKVSNQLKLNLSSTTENTQITVSYHNQFIAKGTINNGICSVHLPDSLLGKNILLTGTKLNYIPFQQNLIIQFPTQIELIKCEGESISYNNKTYSSKGYYTDTLKNNNTDSIINIHIIEYPTFKTFDSVSITKGDSVNIGGKFFLSDTLFTQSLKTIHGCDSTISTKISTKNKTTNFKVISIPSFKIYPTLVDDLLHIISLNSELYTIEFIDQTGKKVHCQTINQKESNIDINHFMKGIYIIHLTSKNEHHIFKVVKE
jgi:gingipain R